MTLPEPQPIHINTILKARDQADPEDTHAIVCSDGTVEYAESLTRANERAVRLRSNVDRLHPRGHTVQVVVLGDSE